MPAISVEVVYALSDRQTIVPLRLDSTSNVRQAISASGILRAHPEIELERVSVGIWSRATTLDSGLINGDRVEIYRPLIADPKITRRRRAGEAAVRKRSPARRSNRC